MKRIILTITLGILFMATPSYAAPGGHHGGGGHAPAMRGGGMARPPMHSSAGMHRAPSSVGHRPPSAGVSRPPVASRPPMGGVRPPMNHHVGVRPMPPAPIRRPIYRPYPVYRPYFYTSLLYPYYYSSYTYYPTATYVYDTPVGTEVNAVIVRDNYAGINTAANIINTAANVAATIRLFTW